MAFTARIDIPSERSRQSIWATYNHELVPIIREAQVVDVDPGDGLDLRTVGIISALGISASGGEDGNLKIWRRPL